MDNQSHLENYLRSIDKNVRRIKAAVHGILVFFTFIFAVVVIGGIYLWVQKDALIKSYVEQFRDSMKETIDSISEKMPSKQ
jgi:hypothetical protein